MSGADLSQMNLAEANLDGANLERANLSKANLSKANLFQTNLKGANLSQANLDGANLERANLSKANLSKANLFQANLKGANLSRTNLDGANLDGVNLDGVNLDGAKLTKAKPKEVKPKEVKLKEVKSKGAKSKGANLSDTNLDGTNLSKAKVMENESPAAKEKKKDWEEPNTGMEFVWVEGGCYEMGDTFGDGRKDERPVHEVCVAGFYIGRYEVTLGQWQEMIYDNIWQFRKGDNYPVELVSFDDALNYIREFSSFTGSHFRLPTEAEWEYAARSGGRKEKYAGGNEIDPLAWYGVKSGGTSHPVGSRKANGLGLYDMTGNVGEWVQDWYDKDYYEQSPKNNPQGPESGKYRVFRGGGGFDRAHRMRTTFRDWMPPDNRLNYLGMRLVVAPTL